MCTYRYSIEYYFPRHSTILPVYVYVYVNIYFVELHYIISRYLLSFNKNLKYNRNITIFILFRRFHGLKLLADTE